MAVIVNQDVCTGCGICIKSCPEPGVINRGEGRAVSIDTAFCKMCLLCASICPKKAIASED